MANMDGAAQIYVPVIKLRGLFSHGKNGWAGVDGWMYDGCMEMDGWEKECMRMNGGDGNEIINH